MATRKHSIIAVLNGYGPMTTRRLEKAFNVPRNGLSVVLAELRRDGYIEPVAERPLVWRATLQTHEYQPPGRGGGRFGTKDLSATREERRAAVAVRRMRRKKIHDRMLAAHAIAEHEVRESVDEFLARGGQITVCPGFIQAPHKRARCELLPY